MLIVLRLYLLAGLLVILTCLSAVTCDAAARLDAVDMALVFGGCNSVCKFGNDCGHSPCNQGMKCSICDGSERNSTCSGSGVDPNCSDKNESDGCGNIYHGCKCGSEDQCIKGKECDTVNDDCRRYHCVD